MQWIPVATVRLPYPISANRYWRTRVIHTNAGPVVSTYVSKEAKQFKEIVGWMMAKAGVHQPMTGRIRVDIQMQPGCPKDWKKRAKADPLWWADTVQRIDLDNAMKVLLDALTGVAIVDDNQVWKTTSEVMEPEEGIDACTVLRICRGVKDNPQAPIPLIERPQPLREGVFP